ncbi:MAG: hypothetical protein HFJ28_03705 [Clostridia bacterium]|jgi:hypothetical protein|nr:hypothetical protein [Clostridia bacterium]
MSECFPLSGVSKQYYPLPGVRTPPCTFVEYEALTSPHSHCTRTVKSSVAEGCPGIVRQGNRPYSVSPIYLREPEEQEIKEN